MPTAPPPNPPDPSMFDVLLDVNDAVVKYVVRVHNFCRSLNVINEDIGSDSKRLQENVAPCHTDVHSNQRLNQVS